MCNKAVNNYPLALEFVPVCYKTQKMCDKAVNKFFYIFDSIPDWFKTQKCLTEQFLKIPF